MAESKKKLAVVLSRFPLPLDKGDKLRAFEQIKQFMFHFDVHVFCLSDQKIEQSYKDECKNLGISLHLYFLPKWKSYLFAFLGLVNPKPLQVNYFLSYSIRKKMQRDIRLVSPHHIYCQLIRMTEYVKDMHDFPKTLDYMDAFSKGVERRIESARFGTKWVFELEHQRLISYESRIFDYFEHHTIISEQDKKQLFHSKKEEIHCIPNGVRKEFFEKRVLPTKYDAVFVGNLNYPPNIKAVEYIVGELLPEIKKTRPKFTFAAFGAHPSPRVLSFAQLDNVSIFGWTPDIRDAYLSGRIFLAPMWIGTGLQNKLIEAMASGVPCITTTLAGQPLGPNHTDCLLLADRLEEFIERIARLDNVDFYQEMAAKGRQYALDHFDWRNVTSPLIEKLLRN